MNIATVSSKRQITIPKSLLEAIGIYPLGKITLEKDRKMIVLKPLTKSIIEQTAGSLRKYVDPSLLGKSIKDEEDAIGMIIGKHAASEGLK